MALNIMSNPVKFDGSLRAIVGPSCYLAGPMSGKEFYNADAFFDAAQALTDDHWFVVNPAQHDIDMGFDPYVCPLGTETNGNFDLAKALAWDLEQISQVDQVFVLDGWEHSRGVRAELSLAFALKKPVVIYSDWFDDETVTVLSEDDFLKAIQPAEESITSRVAAWEATESTIATMTVNGVKLFNAEDEVRSVSSTGGEKGVKLARFDLLPADALFQVAEHYGRGAEKYKDHNWRKGYEWSKSLAAAARHLFSYQGGEDIDPETGSNHMAAVVFHGLTLLTFAKDFPEFDDRYKA